MNPIDVITAFYQRGESDCTTIATIKTAIARFDINGVFNSATLDQTGNWNIVFKDGGQLNVPDAEIKALAAYSGFQLIQQHPDAEAVYNYALFCFGVFVCNYARMNNYSIEAAKDQIDRGINVFNDKNTPYSSYRYLGILDTDVTMLTDEERGTRDTDVFSNNPLYLLCNEFHAVIGAGSIYDEYGIPTNVKEFVLNHSKRWNSKGQDMWAYKFN